MKDDNIRGIWVRDIQELSVLSLQDFVSLNLFKNKALIFFQIGKRKTEE